MNVAAEITVPEIQTALGRVTADIDVRFELERLVPLNDQQLPYLWVDVAPKDTDRFEEVVTEVDSVGNISSLWERGTTRLYWVDWAGVPDGVFAAASQSETNVKRAVGTPDGWGIQLMAPERDRLASFRDECASRSIPFTLERLRAPQPPMDRGIKLTEPQRKALRLAFENGYYEIPRQTTLDALGSSLNVSRQAVSHRLRRGTKRLIEEVLSDPSDRLSTRLDAAIQSGGEQL